MNKLLRAILVIHPFTQYVFFNLEPLISRVLALTGIVAVLTIYLYSLKEEKQKIAIPWLWAYVLAQSIFLGRPNYCLHISLFFLLYTTVAQMKIDWKYVLYPLGHVCIIMSLLSIMQRFGICQFRYSYAASPGLLGNSTNSAMYIVAVSPFLLMHKRGWIWFAIPIIAVWMLNSASAMLGIFSVIFGYLIIKQYHARLIGFSILCMTATFVWFDKVVKFFSPENKLIIWSRAMTDWKEFAWFGRGLGNFAGRYSINDVSCNMHNHYLYILYTLGIVGFLFLLLWLYPHLKNTQAILPYISIVSILVMAGFSIPMKVYPVMLLTGINLGILGGKYDT